VFHADCCARNENILRIVRRNKKFPSNNKRTNAAKSAGKTQCVYYPYSEFTA
jgi:hypothetical protein